MECPCYTECKDCAPGFQKVIDLKDAGLVIYRHTTHIEDVDIETGNVQHAVDTTEDVYILHNTTDKDLTLADYWPEIDQNTMKCPRCRKINENARKLLKKGPTINGNDVKGICKHCKMKDASCYECQEAVKSFMPSKPVRTDVGKERVKHWLGKIKLLLDDTSKDKKSAHSDVHTNQLYRELKNPVCKPDIEQLFGPHELDSASSVGTSKEKKLVTHFPQLEKLEYPILFKDPLKRCVISSFANEDLDFYTDSDFSKSMLHAPEKVKHKIIKYTTSPHNREVAGQGDPLPTFEKNFKDAIPLTDTKQKADTSKNNYSDIIQGHGREKTDFKPTATKPSSLTAKYGIEKKKIMPHKQSPRDIYNRPVKLPYDNDQWSNETNINQEANLYTKVKDSQDGRHRKYKSTETLVTKVNNISLRHLQANDIIFPKRSHAKHIPKQKSSSELIQHTADKLLVKAKEEKSIVKDHKQAEQQSHKIFLKKDDIEKHSSSAARKEQKAPELTENTQKNAQKASLIAEKNAQKAEKDAQKAEKDAQKVTLRVELEAQKAGLIAEKNSKIAEKNAQKAALIAEKNSKIAEKNAQKAALIAEKNSKIAEKNARQAKNDGRQASKDAQKAEKDAQKVTLRVELEAQKAGLIAEKNSKIAEKNAQKAALIAEKNSKIAEKNAQKAALIAEKNSKIAEKNARQAKNDGRQALKDAQKAEEDAQKVSPFRVELEDQKAGLIAEKNSKIAEKNAQKAALIAEKNSKIAEKNARQAKNDGRQASKAEIDAQKAALKAELDAQKTKKNAHNTTQKDALKRAEEPDHTATVPKTGTGFWRYSLSDRKFIDNGWTQLPTEKVVRKMNVYRMRPSRPEFDWFEHNRDKRLMQYDTGEKLAEFDDNGRGRWFYRNGRMALAYYDAEEQHAGQRFVVYSTGEPDERGRSRRYTLLATFDYLGNGIVFDHSGKIRLKYNQTEGVVLDRSIGPVSHWKWHTLNDPPVLQQVMLDTVIPHKDPDIMKMGKSSEEKPKKDDDDMIAIEFDNIVKEKSKKLSQTFRPFQIRMKALKINEHFSLRVLDQATVYLLYRDGTTNLKLNIGMVLDNKEIVDTVTADVGEVLNNLETLPARTESLAGLQKSIAKAQQYARMRTKHERKLYPDELNASVDKLVAGISRPIPRQLLFTVPSNSPMIAAADNCKCNRKPTETNVYYDTRF